MRATYIAIIGLCAILGSGQASGVLESSRVEITLPLLLVLGACLYATFLAGRISAVQSMDQQMLPHSGLALSPMATLQIA